MAKSIRDSSDAFIKRISQTSLEAAQRVEDKVTSMFQRRFGQRLTLKDGLVHLKAVKVIVSADGYSDAEAEGMREVMERLRLPEAVIEEVLEYDVSSTTFEELVESVPPGSREAKAIISGALTVAALDGLSDMERAAVRKAAELMGLSKELVTAYEARIRLEQLVEEQGDAALSEAMSELRVTMWQLS